MDVVLEHVEPLPRRLRRVIAWPRRVLRRPLGGWNIARAIGKDRPRLHLHEHLRADERLQERILAAEHGLAVHAKPARLLADADEKQPHSRVHDDIAEALEHAVPVVIGKRKLARSYHANEAG